MKVSFVGQPFKGFGWTADWLEEHLSRESGGTLQVAVAWTKRSGLSRMQKSIRSFRARGGTASAIIGIDEGGATEQGLELAQTEFDEVYIFHDKSSRTFHPKVYLLHTGESAFLMIGSNNLTAGGLFNNYEGTLVCELNLALEEDRQLCDEVFAWFEVLRSDRVCLPLTAELIATLTSNPEYRIGDEDRPSRQRPLERGDYDGVTPPETESEVFGKSSSPKSGLAPRLVATTFDSVRERRPETSTPTLSHVRGSASLRWWKRMSAADAQHPASSKTNPTGSLKLTQAGHDIDQTNFFRNTMFGDANWASERRSRGVYEEAIVSVEVVVEGVNRGRMNIKIDHAAYRVAGQGNVSTWLHWGELRDVLQGVNYTGAWVILERHDDGSCRLEITHETP